MTRMEELTQLFQAHEQWTWIIPTAKSLSDEDLIRELKERGYMVKHKHKKGKGNK